MKRMLVFIFGCIGIRSLITYMTFVYRSDPLIKYVSIPTSIIGLAFVTIYVMGWRKTGAETGGEAIWWNSLRPVHGVLWLSASVLALWKPDWVYVVLGIDTLVGLTATLYYRLYLQSRP